MELSLFAGGTGKIVAGGSHFGRTRDTLTRLLVKSVSTLDLGTGSFLRVGSFADSSTGCGIFDTYYGENGNTGGEAMQSEDGLVFSERCATTVGSESGNEVSPSASAKRELSRGVGR